MKQKIFFLLVVVMVVGLFGTNLLMGAPQDVVDKDNYGKVIIRVVDEDTGQNVNEIFVVTVNDPNITHELQMAKTGFRTDKNGYLSFEWAPGNYFLYFFPESSTSKYYMDKSPIRFPETRQNIKVEKGKITEVVKKAKHAGKVRVILKSQGGELINPTEISEKANCRIDIYGSNLLGGNESGSQFTDGDNLNDGEMLIYSICPGTYKMKIELNGLGVSSINLENIEVTENETTEVEVTVNFNYQTGVEGKIVYKNGEPIENLEVLIGGPEGDDNRIRASVYTDSNGYYKIGGLREGLYDISFSKRISKYTFLYIPPKTVYVKANMLSRLDITHKRNKSY